MSSNESASAEPSIPHAPGWHEFWKKEDCCAVVLGLGIVAIAIGLFLSGSTISWIAVAPAKWSTFSQLGSQLSTNAVRYLAQFAAFAVLFTIGTSFIGHRPQKFLP